MPASGWTFLQWLGDVSGNGTTTQVRVRNRNLCAEALFGTALSTTVAGHGSVVMNPTTAYRRMTFCHHEMRNDFHTISEGWTPIYRGDMCRAW